jgi:hypothetical protein
MSAADVIAALLAAGLLNLRGYHHYAGWRWLFLIEVIRSRWTLYNFLADDNSQGLITLIFGLAAFVLMPPSPTQTASKLRGKGWFTERYISIPPT